MEKVEVTKLSDLELSKYILVEQGHLQNSQNNLGHLMAEFNARLKKAEEAKKEVKAADAQP